MGTALLNIPVCTIAGTPASLGDYAGKVLLVVNLASKCGLTPQYEGLQKLYQNYADKGLVVLGFPSNDFAGQEPGSHQEIQQFCSTIYNVNFPLFEKMVVTGQGKHPLYRELVSAQPAIVISGDSFREKLKGYGITPNPEPELLWNFEKFLISRTGEVVARFSPDTVPDDPCLSEVIEAELAKA